MGRFVVIDIRGPSQRLEEKITGISNALDIGINDSTLSEQTEEESDMKDILTPVSG